MRAVLIVAAVVLPAAAASSSAAPDRSSQFLGWRYGPVSGSVTLTVTSPRLVCTGSDRDEKRVIRGTYRISFTGTSLRRIRAAADIGYNLAAGGPAGNTEPIAIHARRTFSELIHVKTVTFDDLGNPICTLEERPCSSSDTKRFRRASNRLNVRMQRRARVRIYPPRAVGFGTCAPDSPGLNLLFADDAEVLPLALFNRPRAVLRFGSSGRVGGQSESGAPIRGTLVYKASIAIVRLPGTPPARCKVC